VKKVIFVFGPIAGIIVFVLAMIIMALCKGEIINFDNGDFFGYSAMVIALSMVFFGVKSYRDNYLKGVITFWKALWTGLLISLVASVTWSVLSEIHYQIAPEANEQFMNKYCDYQVEKLKSSGATQLEIDAQITEIEQMRELHKNPLIRFLMTVALLMPVGIVIPIICAAILRKKEVLPA
jgi:hypothetical protein